MQANGRLGKALKLNIRDYELSLTPSKQELFAPKPSFRASNKATMYDWLRLVSCGILGTLPLERTPPHEFK